MKQLIKYIIYRLGLLTLFHRIRNRKTLTILMLHRVLPENEAYITGADPEWTITPKLLDSLVAFAKSNYQIISLLQLQQYQDHSAKHKLSERALLFTFDDGWQDNFQYAQPILEKHHVSAVLHQVSDCIDNVLFLWQEQLAILNRTNKSAYEELSKHFFSIVLPINEFISEIGKDIESVTELRSLIVDKNPLASSMMLNNVQLEQMLESGFELSSHGKTHQKLSELSDSEVEAELKISSQALESLAGRPITSISLPHGGVNRTIIALALASGYKTIFTSNPVINATEPRSSLWGRIHIASKSISNNGKFSECKAAYFLFLRIINKG